MNQDCYGIGYGIIVRLKASNLVALFPYQPFIPFNSILHLHLTHRTLAPA